MREGDTYDYWSLASLAVAVFVITMAAVISIVMIWKEFF